MDNEVPVPVQVFYGGMLRVEYNIKAYNVVCGMIRLQYVPFVLLVYRVPVIDPVFDITIVYPKIVLHMVELSKKNHMYCIQKKNPYSLCPFHSSTHSVTTTIMMAENNQV